MNKITLGNKPVQDDVFMSGKFYTYRDGTLYFCHERSNVLGINLVNMETGNCWSGQDLTGVKATSQHMAPYTGKITIN